jgi:hypothetical protein
MLHISWVDGSYETVLDASVTINQRLGHNAATWPLTFAGGVAPALKPRSLKREQYSYATGDKGREAVGHVAAGEGC